MSAAIAVLTSISGAAAAAPAIADGSFVRVTSTGEVYRMAGGAPIYVATWSAYGGVQSYTDVDAAWLAAQPLTPRDGTFVTASPGGQVYRVAGGAPIYLTSWNDVGGPQPSVTVDANAITYAGYGGRWDHLRALPADGTFLQGGWGSDPSGFIYLIIGGAPTYVSGWDAVGGPHAFTRVSQMSLDWAGSSAAFSHVAAFPADGTFVRGSASGEVYRFAGGAPLYVTSWAAVGGEQAAAFIDDAQLQFTCCQAAHVRMSPADGTLVSTADGRVWKIDGAVATYVPTWESVGGYQATVLVDLAAIEQAGTGGPFNHLAGYQP